MKALIQFEHRGSATLLELVEESATLRCDFSAPPGAPIYGRLVSCNQEVQLKVRDCRRSRENPNEFVLRGRWVNLSRPAREALAGSLADGQVT